MTISPDQDKPTVYMPSAFDKDSIRYAQKKFHLYQPGDLPEDEILAKVDGILLRQGKLTRAQILKAPRLKCIARNGTGYDMIDKATCLERGIMVTNNPGGNAIPVAELVLGFTLNLMRRIGEIQTRLRTGETIPSITALAPGLYGKTIGLIGMGDTAREAARMFYHGFNCKILIFSPTSPSIRWTTESSNKDEAVIPHTRINSLEELLPLVDVLSLHCPYTPSTHHMIGKSELSLFKPSAVIINLARGGIIDEEALYEALVNKTIGGAGIDVWEQEPPPKERYAKLWDLNNVVAMPHFGGSVQESTRIGCEIAIDILAEVLAGGEPRNRVY